MNARQEAVKKYNEANKEKISERNRVYRLANKDKIKERHKGYNIDIEGRRNARYKHKYNLSLVEYENMYNSQNGLCAICKLPESIINSRGCIASLSVDHCHKTNRVRGLLCRMCNSALGKFKDNTELLQEAIRYLENGSQV